MGRKTNQPDNNKLILEVKNSGVTLIELLISLTIVGLLAVLAIGVFNPKAQMAKARDSKRLSDMKRISMALEDYLNDHPCYPAAIYQDDTCTPSEEFTPYLNPIPCDPETGGHYLYVRPDSCSQFALYTKVEKMAANTSYDDGYNYAISSSNYIAEPLPTGSAPSSVPTSSPVPTGSDGPYGCFNGKCEPLSGRNCDPKYGASSCFDSCADKHGDYEYECTVK